MRFSKITQSCYPEEFVYHDLPEDVISISSEEYRSIINRTHGATIDVVGGKVVIAPPHIETIKEDVWGRIRAKRDSLYDGGLYYHGKWYHTDSKSRIKYVCIASMSKTTSLTWKTMDGTFVSMTPAIANNLVSAVQALDSEIFAVSEQHREAMLSSSDPQNYDYSTGWPDGYGHG